MQYQGSQLLIWVSDYFGVPLDQFNFLICQVFAILTGLAYRSYLKPCPQNTLKRHLVGIIVGILIGQFCFGNGMWHMFFQAFIAFGIMQFCPRPHVHLVIFVWSMGYLAGMHIYRQIYDYGNYVLDITGPIMITTQKLTLLGFAFYDGIRPEAELSADQKSQVIKQPPHIIEFLSYIFNFQGIVVGPACTYNDYTDFISGNNILKNKNPNANPEDDKGKIVQPPITMILCKRIAGVLFLCWFHFTFATFYNMRSNLNEDILAEPIWYRFFYFQFSSFGQRVKFYFAWVLADAVNNASGFGFNGYDEKTGNAKWDLVTNVKIFELETSTSVKAAFDIWNISTVHWLRRIAYDRLHTGKTLGVFVLSAFWHGFYPGYYLTFVLSAFLVYAGRGIRRKIRPFFQVNPITKVVYGVITWTGTIFALNYTAISLELLELKKSFLFYNSWFWIVHVVVITVALALPGGSTKRPKPSATPVDATSIDQPAVEVSEHAKSQ